MRLAIGLLCFAARASSLQLVGTRAPVRRHFMRTYGVAASHCNIYPRFTISDYSKVKSLMDECVASTDNEAACLYYGWTVSEDKTKLFCRETYIDGAGVAAHLVSAAPLVGKMLDTGGVSLDYIAVMGTEKDLAEAKEEADKLGCEYWKVWDSFSNFQKAPEQVASCGSFLTIQPTFTLIDQAKAEPFMRQCVETTKAEPGCLYYGWTISADGTKLFCREAYVDGAAVNTHLLGAVPIVGAMLDSGAATLDSIELHGPRAEWAACKEEADKLGMAYFDVDSSFGKFAM